MENMKYLGLLIFFILPTTHFGAKTMQKIVSMKNIFGHIHRNPNRHSSSVSTVHCGYPLTILAKNGRFLVNGNWYYTETGPFKGFVHRDHVLQKRGPCFQKTYPQFFDKVGLTLTDYYKLGRLHDLFLSGVSKAQ